MLRRSLVLTAVFGLVATLSAASATASPGETWLLFSPEGDRLNIFDITDPTSVDVQLDVPITLEGVPADGPQRDINGQTCFFEGPDGSTMFVAGEDFDQPENTPFFDALGLTERHGELPGWGIYRLEGDRLGEFRVFLVGKLVPTYQPHLVTQYEHFGCAILSDGRIVVADIGDQFPGLPANGQLMIFFPPYDSFHVPYCKVDIGLPTAGGMLVDDQDRVYVAFQRDDVDPLGYQAGIHRYTVDWPDAPNPDGGCGRVDQTGAPLIDADRMSVENVIPGMTAGLFEGQIPFVPEPGLVSPSGIVRTLASDGYYVSSVFDGRIHEYDADGTFVREILAPPPEETGQPPYSTGTPLGIARSPDGTLFYADLGVVVGPPPGPEDGSGKVRMIRFDAAGEPLEPEVLLEDLDFPDGLGILVLPAVPAPIESPPPPEDPAPPLPATGGGLLLAALLLGPALVLSRRET